MELSQPSDQKTDPLINCDNINSTSSPHNVQYSEQRKDVLIYKYKRNFGLLTFVYIVLLVLIIILVASITESYCPCSKSNQHNANDKNNQLLIDTKNRSCFYKMIRLPKSIIPLNYTIYLHPNISDLSKPSFTGYVLVDCVCKQPTNFLVIHAKSLKLTDPSVTLNFDKPDIAENLTIADESFCTRLDQYYLKFYRPCHVDEKLRLKINFNADLEKRLDGFYLSDYRTKSGELKTLITTHMEPTFARQAFPCFDEPFFKANFSLQMIRDDQHFSLFNMPLESTTKLPNGLLLDKYQSTVKMSTYLVAYMLLPRDYISLNGYDANNRTKIRIFGPKDQREYTTYALNVSKKVLPFFENVFGLEYPLPKLDMIAIPDFSAGAMENWGLITYKMIALLIRPTSTKILHRSSIVKIISHEIAHQWFGNIVTMDWWNDLWLNEGFASYTEYLGGDFADKEWRMLDLFYIDQYVDAMHFDSLVNSHPIQVPVNDPQEIESIFDQISYGKGACLVRMLEGILGMPTLKEGLSIYLKRYRYRNAFSDSLWEAFSEAYKMKMKKESIVADKSNPLLNLKKVMSTWLNQMNFPLVSVIKTGRRSFQLTQERFLVYPNSTKYWESVYTNDKYEWSIPILYLTDKMAKPELIWLLDNSKKTINLDHDFNWIKLNYGQMGFFRVNYEDMLWYKLTEALQRNTSQFNSVDRAGLLSDAFALARAGKLNISIALELSTYLKTETDLVPWYVAIDVFNDVTKQLYFDSDLSDQFENFAKTLVEPMLKSPKVFQWNDKGLTAYETLVQSAVIQFAIRYKVPSAFQLAMKHYNIYKTTGKITNSNLHLLTLHAAITNDSADGKEWKEMMNQMMTSKDPDIRRGVRKALAKTQNSKLLNRLFNTVMRKFKHQDLVSVLFDAAQRNEAGVDQAWLFVQRHWQYFEKNVAQQYFLVGELFKICNGLLTESDYDQANRFFASKKLGFGERSANQSLEMIKSNIYWNKNNKNDLRYWLKTNL